MTPYSCIYTMERTMCRSAEQLYFGGFGRTRHVMNSSSVAYSGGSPIDNPRRGICRPPPELRLSVQAQRNGTQRWVCWTTSRRFVSIRYTRKDAACALVSVLSYRVFSWCPVCRLETPSLQSFQEPTRQFSHTEMCIECRTFASPECLISLLTAHCHAAGFSP